MLDFPQRYKADEAYRHSAIEIIKELIQSDGVALSVNPVFGTLWRTVCSDRQNKARDKLTTMLGTAVENITDANTKSRVKKWLEESYDYAAEINDWIESVPDAERFPCVYLDPLLSFDSIATDDQDGEEEEGSEVGTELIRSDLLEIGRSCDHRILKRMGKVLTRLTYATTRAELSVNIQEALDPK